MEDFFIILNYQGNELTVQIEDSTNTIQDIIDKIINGLGLSKTDAGGNPVTYHLGMTRDGEELILQNRIKGEEKTLMDYNIQSGDRVTLTMIPIAG
jgi:hypothetical protein